MINRKKTIAIAENDTFVQEVLKLIFDKARYETPFYTKHTYVLKITVT